MASACVREWVMVLGAFIMPFAAFTRCRNQSLRLRNKLPATQSKEARGECNELRKSNSSSRKKAQQNQTTQAPSLYLASVRTNMFVCGRKEDKSRQGISGSSQTCYAATEKRKKKSQSSTRCKLRNVHLLTLILRYPKFLPFFFFLLLS
ncbi:uncharacterized protein B0I36DRAFT_327809 [Microdochium trichocladiopsis]|uniref:Uncharacterized protein n=1 Tax=Microdochium trichocladiopsis TaxID=1682393 RepID=A0A9P9BNH7_9PEZI|nr:uncharacterized protein B0I36DRAFT_327809 [Microdochium trichocladiopsis]KAH7027746.1 hypothetical protein B0I36DRAFT_327809 [Microdochium trichocladiopsis]